MNAKMRVVRAGIDTYQQPVVYMHKDCEVCRSEGFAALTRVNISVGNKELIATLNVVVDDHLGLDEVALSEAAWNELTPKDNSYASFKHVEPARSSSALRAKVFGKELAADEFNLIVQDIVANRLSDLELAAFVTACAGDRLSQTETNFLTSAMISVGSTIDWGSAVILDKHCVGGLPGNRTTPIVVAIVAALGYTIPKTSSRAITSPAGTADTMQVMTPVDLNLEAMRRVVEQEGGCIVWGGNVRLSPADDILIRVERPLNFDSDGQLVASVLSKKSAAGSSHVLIDVPVGATAKIRSMENAESLSQRLRETATHVGLNLGIHFSDGSQPVGYGIGPALEAHDVLKVLRGELDAPQDLRERSLDLAAALIDLAPDEKLGASRLRAESVLDNGLALSKFYAICNAQGGFSEPILAKHRTDVLANHTGYISTIDNRRLATVAKLAGAPAAPAAGLTCFKRIGEQIDTGDVLYTIYAESPGELEYALEYARLHKDIFELQEDRL